MHGMHNIKIRIRYAAELARVIKPEKSEGLHEICVPKWFWSKQAHSLLCDVCSVLFKFFFIH
jgi:hypothetical protein